MTRDERARARVVERVAEAARERLDPAGLYHRVVESLARVLPVESACWHLNDPLTGVITRTGAIGTPPGTYEEALELEFVRGDDVGLLAEVLRRPRPVSVLGLETRGAPAASSRYRELLEPAGARDELRAGFVDATGRWGSIVLFGAAPFSAEDADLVALLSPVVAQGIRLAATREPAPPADDRAPGVLVLDPCDRVRAADARARARLAELAAGDAGPGLPGVVHVLAAQARLRDATRPAHARAQTRDGRWYLLDASLLADDPAADVAVVLQPAPAESLVETHLLAHGLTAREREVALLVLAGGSTDEIARRLVLSPWTVQDHLKAVFAKVGVRSRRELVARIGLDAATGAR